MPGSTSRSDSAIRSPSSANARAAGGSPSRSASARSSARSRSSCSVTCSASAARSRRTRSSRTRRGCCSSPARLEAAEPSSLLDQRAALLRLRREDRLDLALPDDRVHPLAEAEVGEQLDEIEPAHAGLVQEVLALAAAMEAARDGDLGEVDRERVIGVVEKELDLAEVGGAATGCAREQDVVRLLGAQLQRAQRAGRPADGVGHVRLAGAVRPDDDADALFEANFDRVRERLEAANLDRAQMHRRGPYRACTTALLGVVFRVLAGERGRLVPLEELEDAAPLGLLGVLVEPLVEALVGVLLAGHGVRMPEPGALRGPPPVRRPSSSLPPPRRVARRPRARRT